MALEVYAFAVTVPAGTLKAAPLLVDLTMPPRVVTEIEIRVPPGPRGEVGFAIGAAKAPVIPRGSGQWIVTDDEIVKWPLESQISSGAWQCLIYNTGSFPHTIQVRFQCELTQGQRPPPLQLLPGVQLAG